MGESFYRRKGCRLCGGASVELVLSLTPTPPANAFVCSDALDKPQLCFPLDVFFCHDCHHVQLLDVVDPHLLFDNYVYVSGTSPVFVQHFQDYANLLISKFDLKPGQRVVEIGSNDGTMLAFLKDAGLSVMGIDPARNISRQAIAKGIPTLPVFFSNAVAKQLVVDGGPVSLVVANNVFAHADNLSEIADGVLTLLNKAGVFVFEVSYLMDVMDNTLFDLIYHEHLSYHAIAPLQKFFAARGLDLFAVQRVETHGGSIRGFVQRAGGPHSADGSVAELISMEKADGLDKPSTLKKFGLAVNQRKDELTALLRGLKAQGHSIAGYGAPAKATTLSFHFGLGADVLDFVVDDSPLKQGLFTPGTHIPVLSSAELGKRKPDYLLLLAWNFAEPIMAKAQDYRNSGGRFIIPLPYLAIK